MVACALISITLNPILFRFLDPLEAALKRRPALWRFLNRRTVRRGGQMNQHTSAVLDQSDAAVAVIVGYGPVGRSVDSILAKSGLQTVVVDLNMDTVQALTREGRAAIYGDAYDIEVLAKALPRATHLIIALPHALNRNPLIVAAKLINPALKVFVRARYLAERDELAQVGADDACFEEAEAAVGLARLVLLDRGADAQAIQSETTRIRQSLVGPGTA